MSKLQIEYKRIDEITPYEKNPRRNDSAVEFVAESIKEFGFLNPILLDANGTIMAGHTRLKAAKRLGMEEVPVVYVEDLTEEQAKAFRLADNKTAEAAEWDAGILERELSDILDIDMTLFGFEGEIEDELTDKQEPEVKFSEELLEENNYVVLFFDNSVDWLQAQEVLGIVPKQALHSKEGYKHIGVGRVINGVEFIERLTRNEY